jgi:hypothetical protein
VVVARTKVDNYYFDEGTVHFFQSGDSRALAEAILNVAKNEVLRKTLVSSGYQYVERNGWGKKKQKYIDLVDSLTTEKFETSVLPERTVSGKESASVRHPLELPAKVEGDFQPTASERALFSLAADKRQS